MGRADRSADVWARTYPGAFRLAFLLAGDRAAAGRIAERTFVRIHARYRGLRGRARVTFWLGTVAISSVSIAAGYYGLQTGDSGPPVERARTIQVPGLRGASDARSDLARFGAPKWCPDLNGTTPIGDESHGAAAESAIRFDIALAKGSYQKTIRALLHPSPGAPARTRYWPHHRDTTGLGVIQISAGWADPDLVRACGSDAADRTLKVAIWQQGANDGASEVIAFYTVLSPDRAAVPSRFGGRAS